MANTATMLSAYSDAALAWHRLFTADRIRHLANPNLYMDLEIFLTEMRQIRWGLIATENQIGELWDKVMPGVVIDPDQALNEPPVDKTNQDIIDFVLNGTAYIHSRTGYQSGHYESFIAEIVKNMSWIARTPVMDESTSARAGKYEFLLDFFKATPWMLFMYILSVTEFPPLLSEADLKATLSPQKQDE